MFKNFDKCFKNPEFVAENKANGIIQEMHVFLANFFRHNFT